MDIVPQGAPPGLSIPVAADGPTHQYRAMAGDGTGGPKLGDRDLGVRLVGTHADLPVDDNGAVEPETGGMSVFADPMSIPRSYRPQSLLGTGNKPIWSIAVATVPDGLRVAHDHDDHWLVEPSVQQPAGDYVERLEATQNDWECEYE